MSTESEHVCQWKHDEWHDYFSTTCGQAFCFENEDVGMNNFRFCPFCGFKIEVVESKKEQP